VLNSANIRNLVYTSIAFAIMLAYFLVIIKRNGAGAARMIIAGTAISLTLVFISYGLKFLSATGAASAFLMGCNIFGMGGMAWAVPLLTFFLSSSILSKMGRSRKEKYDLIFDKGSQRDAGQVLANGGLAWLLIILYSFGPHPALYFAFLAALAAVQADSWSTEIGTMIRDPRPYSIATFEPVPPGTSGGVTWMGTFGGLAGALLISASAWASAPSAMRGLGVWISVVMIGLAGLLGSLVDSILGATLQARYYDPVREKVTERAFRQTPDGPMRNQQIAGHAWFTNDVVNFGCSLAGAAVALLLLSL
jgi:uncharacterized protein (TIGR00297 family)